MGDEETSEVVRRRRRRRCCRGAAIGLSLLATLVASTATTAAVPFVFDGTVDTVVQQGPWTYVAGTFSRAVMPAGGGVVLSTRGAAPRPVAAERAGVRAADGVGGWYVSDGTGVVHVDARGRAVWRVATDAAVASMARAGAALYLAGGFKTVHGSAREGLAAVRVTDGRLLDWAPTVTERGSAVPATIVGAAGGAVVLTGDFDAVGGSRRTTVAGVDAVTGRATALRLPLSDRKLTVAAVAADRLYVTGAFTRISGRPRSRLAALDARSGRLLDWDPRLAGRSLAPRGDRAADDVPPGDVNGVVPAGPIVYVSGRFTRAGQRAVTGLAALTTATARATSWAPSHVGPVQVLAAGGGHVYAVSRFRHGTAIPATPWLAQLDPRTGHPSSWDAELVFGAGWRSQYRPLLDGVQLSAARAYVHGSFYGAGRPLVALGHIARLNGDGELDTRWRPTVGGAACAQPNPRSEATSSCVTAIVAGPRSVYLGGGFTTLGRQRRDGVGAVDVTTGAVTLWAPKLAGRAVPQAVHDGDVLLAGDLTAVDGQPRRGLATVDQTNGRVSALDLHLDGPVGDLAVDGGTAYLAGGFSHIGASPRGGVAAVDLTTGQPTPWAADASVTGAALAVTLAPTAAYVETRSGTPPNATSLHTFDRATGTLTATTPGQSGRTFVAVLGNRVYFQGSAFWHSIGPTGDVVYWNVDIDYPYAGADVIVFGRKAMAATATRLALAGAFSQAYDGTGGPDPVASVPTGPFALVDPVAGIVAPTTVSLP
jgi:hypothetical protein